MSVIPASTAVEITAEFSESEPVSRQHPNAMAPTSPREPMVRGDETSSCSGISQFFQIV